jgi:hypothetical protein
MGTERHDERRAPQHESPAEREARKNPANQQDLDKPAQGRDEPPGDAVKSGKRDPESPWMGGG